MEEDLKTKPHFQFFTRLHLSELTGRRATTIEELLEIIRDVPGACIYHHTHRFLQQHQYLSPEPPNDFAYWVGKILGEDVLGEKLASIDTIQFSTLRSLREKIISTIGDYLQTNPLVKGKFAHPEEAFHFIKSISFVLPTQYVAFTIEDFLEIFKKITVDSIYFHIFEARLRLEKKTNDFAWWIETSLGHKKLADRLTQLDPYTYTLEELRKTIIRNIEEFIVDYDKT